MIYLPVMSFDFNHREMARQLCRLDAKGIIRALVPVKIRLLHPWSLAK